MPQMVTHANRARNSKRPARQSRFALRLRLALRRAVRHLWSTVCEPPARLELRNDAGCTNSLLCCRPCPRDLHSAAGPR